MNAAISDLLRRLALTHFRIKRAKSFRSNVYKIHL